MTDRSGAGAAPAGAGRTTSARARGYRTKNKMITIIYLTAAKLILPTVTNPTPAYMSSR